VTPYVFAYDLVVLAVPTAFLLRFCLAHGHHANFEAYGLAAAGALLLSYIVATTQVRPRGEPDRGVAHRPARVGLQFMHIPFE